MWITKLKIYHDDCHIVPLCKKHNVTTYAFPGSSSGGVFKRNNKTFLAGFHHIMGEEENKNAFFKDLKKDKRLEELSIKKNYFSYLLKIEKGEKQVQLYYDPILMFLKPVINSPDGFEYWEIGSWEKEALTKFIEQIKAQIEYCEILKIEKNDFTDIYFPMVLPKLSEKQKKAILLAKERGYYSYPRKVELKDLANEAKVSIPTFQEHIRKAEIKLLPFMIDQM